VHPNPLIESVERDDGEINQLRGITISSDFFQFLIATVYNGLWLVRKCCLFSVASARWSVLALVLLPGTAFLFPNRSWSN
jgi:hypothetical protein